MNKTVVLAVIDDLVTDFLSYDRKEDEDLPRGAIEELIAAGKITEDDIVAHFKKRLHQGLR